MKKKFILPKTTAQATKVAGTLSNEATEREFSLASLVFAQVLPFGKRKDVGDSSVPKVSTKEFADRKIRGLTSHVTVRAYRDTWQALVDAGHVQEVRLGDTAEWPSELVWSDWYSGDPRDGTDERHIAKDKVVSKETIKAAVEEDPTLLKDVVKSGSQKVRKAARDGVVEANAEAYERAGRAAEIAAVERGNPPMGPDSDEEELGAAQLRQGDYAVAEGKRRDWVWELEADAKALYEKFQAGAEEFGHTGVPDEVEVLQNAVHLATEFAFGVNGFIVDNASEEVAKK